MYQGKENQKTYRQDTLLKWRRRYKRKENFYWGRSTSNGELPRKERRLKPENQGGKKRGGASRASTSSPTAGLGFIHNFGKITTSQGDFPGPETTWCGRGVPFQSRGGVAEKKRGKRFGGLPVRFQEACTFQDEAFSGTPGKESQGGGQGKKTTSSGTGGNNAHCSMSAR